MNNSFFTIKFKNSGEINAQMVQESLRRSSEDGKRLTIQQITDTHLDIIDIHRMLEQEGNLEEISVYNGDEKVASYNGYEKIDSITKSLQAMPEGTLFVIDIQLTR